MSVRNSIGRRLVSRRSLLQSSIVGAGAIAFTAACSSSHNGSSTQSPASSASSVRSATQAATARKGGRITVGSIVDLLPINQPYQLNTPYLVQQFSIYDTLFRYDTLALQPVPRLAASYEFNGDQTALTIALRPNLQFHSGKPLDAQAVVDSFNSLTAAGTPPNQPSGIAKAYVDTAQAIDSTHVKFSLKRPGMLVFDLFNFWLIADAANIPDLQKGGRPNGSGPFKVTAATPKQGGTLDAFPAFWQPARLDGIDYKVYPDPSTLAVAVQSGSIGLTKDLVIDDALRFSKKSGFRVLKDKGLTAEYAIGMNTTGSVMKDARVRQALYHSVDRQNIVSTVFLDQSTAVNDLWPKGSPGYEARYAQDPFDIQKAKQLLAQAGYASGTPSVQVITPAGQPVTQQIMQMIQATAKQAGLNLTIQQLEDTIFTQEFQEVTYPGCYITGFGFNQMHPDSLFVMNYQMRIPNSAGYTSSAYQSLLSQLASATTDSSRHNLYLQLNQLWDQDMWVFPVCSQTFEWLTTSKVGGFTVNEFSVPSMEKMYLT